MSRVRGIIVLLLALILVVPAANAADGKAFSISKNMTWYNCKPRIAVNTVTGDAVVIWLRSDRNAHYPEDGRMMSAWCRHKKRQGKIVVKPAREIDHMESMDTFPDLAFNPDEGSYFAVYTPWRYSAEYGNDLPDIVGIKLNAKGVPLAAVVDIAASAHLETSPQIAWCGTSTASASASPPGAYLLVYNYYTSGDLDELEPGDREAGLYGIFLDEDGAALSSTPFLISYAEKEIDGHYAGRMWTSDLMRADDGTYLLCSARVSMTDARAPFLTKLRVNGRGMGEIQLDDTRTNLANTVQLAPDLFMACWDNDRISGKDTSYICTFDGDLAAGAGIAPLGKKAAWPIHLVKLAESPGAVLLAGDGKTLYALYIAEDGTVSKTKKKLFKFRSKLVDLEAVCMPGCDRIFIAWTKKKGLNDAEVLGYTFDAASTFGLN